MPEKIEYDDELFNSLLVPVSTKSTHPDRIEENLRIFDFELPGEAMPRLDPLDRTDGTSHAIETRIMWW